MDDPAGGSKKNLLLTIIDTLILIAIITIFSLGVSHNTLMFH